MLTFTLAISCLTTSNLPWFMDLTFQVPMQYCSLQHQTLLPSPVPFTTGCCFCFCSIPSFFPDKAMAPHPSTRAWKIPWTEEPGRLQSMGSWRVGHDWATSLSLSLHSLILYGVISPLISNSILGTWTTDLGSSSFNVLSFCLFILFMGFSRQEYWSGLPFPSPVDHILSDLSTMTRPSWVAPHGMA